MSLRALLLVIVTAFVVAVLGDCTTMRPCPVVSPCTLPPVPVEYHAHAVRIDGGSFVSDTDAVGISEERDALRDWVRIAAPCVSPQ